MDHSLIIGNICRSLLFTKSFVVEPCLKVPCSHDLSSLFLKGTYHRPFLTIYSCCAYCKRNLSVSKSTVSTPTQYCHRRGWCYHNLAVFCPGVAGSSRSHRFVRVISHMLYRVSQKTYSLKRA